jgi:hypothetical protein
MKLGPAEEYMLGFIGFQLMQPNLCHETVCGEIIMGPPLEEFDIKN